MFAVPDDALLSLLAPLILGLRGHRFDLVAEGVVLLDLELLPPFGEPGVEVADQGRHGLRRVVRGRVQHQFGQAWQEWGLGKLLSESSVNPMNWDSNNASFQ